MANEPHIHLPYTGRFGAGRNYWQLQGASNGGINVPVANRVTYHEVIVPMTVALTNLWVVTGGASTGTLSLGIYTEAGALLGKVDAAVKLTNTVQHVAVPLTLQRGRYYVAFVASNLTDTYFAITNATVTVSRMIGQLQEDIGGMVLPATMTPVAAVETPSYLVGLCQSATL